MESNYENLMCHAAEIVAAIERAAKMNVIAILMTKNWTYPDALKIAKDAEKDTK